MNRIAVAQELVKLAKSLVSDSSLVPTLLKMKPGKRLTLGPNDIGLYVHIWFDSDVARDDFGNRAFNSGEWQIIISKSDDALRGRVLSRHEFRYAEDKNRSSVARAASDWVSDQVYQLTRLLKD